MKIIKWSAIVSIIIGILPFLPYIYCRLNGSLPSPDAWFMPEGPYHDPWKWMPAQLVIIIPMMSLMVLPIVLFVNGTYFFIWKKESKIIL